MTTALAIEPSTAAIGNAGADPNRYTPQSVLHEPLATRPISAPEPAVEVSKRQALLRVEWVRSRSLSYRLVDALVTFAVIAWFTTALLWMVGEGIG